MSSKNRDQLEVEIAALRRRVSGLEQSPTEFQVALKAAEEELQAEIARRLRAEEAGCEQARILHAALDEKTRAESALRATEQRLHAILDNTDRKQAEEQLRSEQRFLKQLIHAHERDRKLTAYEIHDGMLQYVSGALLHIESLTGERSPLAGKRRDALELAAHLLRRSIEEGRRVMSGLRPPILDEEGIVMAVEYLVVEQSEHGKLHIDFGHCVAIDRLDPLLEGTIFRIVQEALNNVRRHSRATRAEVRLIENEGRLRVEIHDDGVGFDPEKVPDDRFGVAGIRKRAALFGGRAHITSEPGRGTHIVVDLPLTPALKDEKRMRDEG